MRMKIDPYYEKLARGIEFERKAGSGHIITIRQMKNREVVECYKELKDRNSEEIDDRLICTLAYEIRKRNIRMKQDQIQAVRDKVSKVEKKVQLIQEYTKKIEKI